MNDSLDTHNELIETLSSVSHDELRTIMDKVSINRKKEVENFNNKNKNNLTDKKNITPFSDLEYERMIVSIRYHCDLIISASDLKYIHTKGELPLGVAKIFYKSDTWGAKANIARLISFLNIPLSKAKKIFYPVISNSEVPKGKRFENDFIKELKEIFQKQPIPQS